MKKLMIILFFALFTGAVNAQMSEIIDTLVRYDAKLQLSENYVNTMIEQLSKKADAEKVESGKITNKQATIIFVKSMQAALNNYKKSFFYTDTIAYKKIGNDYYQNGDTTKIGVISEYKQLNSRIQKLKNDPDIKYIDAIKEFQKLQSKKILLNKRYGQLRNNNK